MRPKAVLLIVTLLTSAVFPSMLLAQADAQKAFESGKTAYLAADYAKARDQFLAASRTDNRNPEVFLWLGKAHYQLGEVAPAMAAWRRTLALAPDEPFAKRMLAALSGEALKIDVRIRLIETMLAEKLHGSAIRSASALLKETGPTDAQRATVMLLLSRAQLGTGRADDALETVSELLVRYPKLADAAGTTLVLARARFSKGGEGVAEAIRLFRKIAADHPNTLSAASARYELIVIDLTERVTPQRVRALEQWIAANPTHGKVNDARRRLITSLFEITVLSGRPAKDAKLRVTDEAAFKVALELLKQMANATDAHTLTKQLTGHLDRHYAAHGAHQAAIDGANQLLNAPLPSSSRLLVLRRLSSFQHQRALEHLRELAKSGGIRPGALPQPVNDMLTTLGRIRTEFPEDRSSWLDQALLARALAELGGKLPWPSRVRELKTPLTWALQLALPVIRADAEEQAVGRAVRVVNLVVGDCRKVRGIPGMKLALSVNTQLLAAVSKERPAWRSAASAQLGILDGLAKAVFTENIRLGRTDRNAAVSPHQDLYLTTLVALRREDPTYAATALGKLKAHVEPWVRHGHTKVAETLLDRLEKELPPTVRREAQLEVARLWIREVTDAHKRLTAAGLAIPRQLDPAAGKAASRLYALQDDLDEKDPFLAAVREVLKKLVDHYVNIEYDDVAGKVLTTTAARPSPAAEAWTKLELARVHFGKAKRDFERTLATYSAREKITLTAEFASVIAEHTKFISDHPSHPLVGRATNGVFVVAQLFEKHKAHHVAAGVYRDFVLFAAKVKQLTDAAPGSTSVAENAAYSYATALENHARQVLAKMLAERKPDATPPVKLSDEFAAAVDAYKELLSKNPTGPLALSARRQIELVALEYARRDAWDVADGVYAHLVAELKTLRHPERLELARGLCRLGHAMPHHARRVLRSLIGGDKAKPVKLKPPAAVLSDDEIARRRKAIDAAYAILFDVMRKHPHTPSAGIARGEIMTMIDHWRMIGRPDLAADLGTRLLTDRPADPELPKLRLAVARDSLTWATQPPKKAMSPQEKLAEVTRRFEKARTELAALVADFPNEHKLIRQAQWELAQSWLTQARAVAAFSPTLARGQYVRAAREIQQVAVRFGDHPNIGQIPQMLWNIGAELFNRRYYDEAVLVWNELTIGYPTHALSRQAALRVAQTTEKQLGKPLRAAELYQELHFARGSSDGNLSNAIFNIGSQLKSKKRWVEALHVLESFVDSFPRHPKAGQALTMIGQIHQANEAWTDAIEAYRRVIDEYPSGNWVHDAKWSIAECTINLSRWRDAADAYRTYLAAYRRGRNSAEAKRRIDILKDLQRYQTVVDEEGQRKAFDAQYQIATILRDKLSNPVKAIIEFRKVATNWQGSHLADDALYAVGMTYLSISETARARKSLLLLARQYRTSPLADDALHMVGRTFEEEAQKLAAMDKKKEFLRNEMIAQKQAYHYSQSARRQMRAHQQKLVKELKASGDFKMAGMAEAQSAANTTAFDRANVILFANKAQQEVERLTAAQLADRQDKINAALRKGLDAYAKAAKVAGADKAGDALLRMAVIYDVKLKDAPAAMKTWLEIVRQFSGTAVAEDASWKIAQTYERERKYEKAITAYEAFLRNYRRSPRAGAAQFAVAENFEHLGKWVNAMDAYTNYINNFPKGTLVGKAREQINWIKTYRL